MGDHWAAVSVHREDRTLGREISVVLGQPWTPFGCCARVCVDFNETADIDICCFAPLQYEPATR